MASRMRVYPRNAKSRDDAVRQDRFYVHGTQQERADVILDTTHVTSAEYWVNSTIIGVNEKG